MRLLIMKRIKMINNTKYIAHRGLSGLAPENSSEAFTLAGIHQYYGTECDIHVTKDGEFVVFHDSSLERMTGVKGLIKELTASEIRQLSLISGKGIKNYPPVLIPFLSEYLDICLKYNMVPVIEIKSVRSLNDLNRLLQLLNAKSLLYKAQIISFNLEYLIYLRNKDPKLVIFYLVDVVNNAALNLCKTYFMGINANCQKLTKKQIINCHSNNILVNTYTVDNLELAKYLSDAGIDFITTNILKDNH